MKHSQQQARQEPREPERAAQPGMRAPSAGTLAGMIAQSPQAIAQRKLISGVNQSPRMVAQRMHNAALSGRGPVAQMQGMGVNEDRVLEHEADVMGAKSLALGAAAAPPAPSASRVKQSVRRAPALQFAPGLYRPALDDVTRTAKQNEGPAGHRINAAHMAHKGYHKINRIAGVLFPIALMAPVRAPLQLAIAEINASAVAAVPLGGGTQRAAIRDASVTVLNQVIADVNKTVQQADECALLGPLDYWSNLGAASAPITTRLRALRFEMMQRARISIIAHRAMGATNRSFGGLIPDDDPARQRPTENSPAAFRQSLNYATSAANQDGIDGVECDVFLSRDGVAMLSHDSNIRDQMSAAQRLVFDAAPAPAGETSHSAKIEHYDAADLTAMHRRVQLPVEALDASAFMTLTGLLTTALPTATAYAAHTGKAFRVEIEMKGHNVGVHNIIDVTAKTISQFKKANPASHNLEIVMFNGTPADVVRHAAKRTTKSRLGGLIVGLGGVPAGAPNPAIDEFRGSLAKPGQVRVAAAPHISTYVLGAESSLLDGTQVDLLDWPLPAAVMGIVQANLNNATDEEDVYDANQLAIDADIMAAIPAAAPVVAPPLAAAPVAAPVAAVAPVVPAVAAPAVAAPVLPPATVLAIAARKRQFTYTLRVERGRQNRLAHLAAQHALPNAHPDRTHVLTDFPERAAETRARIAGGPVPPIAPPVALPPVAAPVAVPVAVAPPVAVLPAGAPVVAPPLAAPALVPPPPVAVAPP